jgi:hypothetical protein
LSNAEPPTCHSLRDVTAQGVIKLSLGKKRHVLLRPV